jgi:hypothetical protein
VGNPLEDLLAVHGQHDNRKALVLGSDDPGQRKSIALAQEQVDQDKVGHLSAYGCQRLAGRLRLATNMEGFVAIDETSERPPHQGVVVHDKYLSLMPHTESLRWRDAWNNQERP